MITAKRLFTGNYLLTHYDKKGRIVGKSVVSKDKVDKLIKSGAISADAVE